MFCSNVISVDHLDKSVTSQPKHEEMTQMCFFFLQMPFLMTEIHRGKESHGHTISSQHPDAQRNIIAFLGGQIDLKYTM